MADPLATPLLEQFADLTMDVAAPQALGTGMDGLNQAPPILGGAARDSGRSARVLTVGNDFRSIASPTCLETQ